jgi:hypothetical protein
LNDKTPLLISLIAAAILATALLVFQPYSLRSGSPSPWQAYTRPAQQYLTAALKNDSLELVEQSASMAPVVWSLAAARRFPESLAVWAREAKVWTGFRRGDTAEVLLQTETDVCSEHPIWLRFVGKGDQVKVVEAGSGCF